ncbi:MAG: response regulator [Methanomicrobiales archaeon]|nr:response regulator [Methanomicrobiales archaeon]
MVTIIPVLFVDDNRELSNIFQFYLEETGLFSVHVCLDGHDALRYIAENQVEVVISDYDMPDMDGITLLKQIRNSYPALPFIMLTGNDSKETAIDALNSGADFYQNKSEDLEIQVLDLSHKLIILVEKAQALAAVTKKDKILEMVSKTAGHLLSGGVFTDEMRTTLREVSEVIGAKAISIGNPVIIEDDTEIVPPDFIFWIRNTGDNPGIQDIDTMRSYLSTLVSFISAKSEKSGRCIQVSSGFLDPSLHTICENLGIVSCFFLPVFVGTDQWGFLSLFFDRSKQELREPEKYALTMLAEVAGAARYRAHMEEYFKNPVEKSLVGLFLLRNNRFIYINPRFSTTFGLSHKEMIRTRSLPALFTETDEEHVRKAIEDICSGITESAHLEVSGLHSDGSQIFIELYMTTFRYNGSSLIAGNCLDITPRKKAEEKVRVSEERLKQNMMTSLREKETLLREIHHRVKNNMQIIASLLRLSGFKSGNPKVQDIIRDCRNRIFSMAAIHEKLYQTEQLSAVPLGEYIRDVGSRIIIEFEIDRGQVLYDVCEHKPVFVDINFGIPIGLIINELITNSIKHAFPGNKAGKILVEVGATQQLCQIHYSDNGTGLPPNFSLENMTTLGIELIQNLTCQIQGTATFTSDHGMHCFIEFPNMLSRCE